MSSTLDELMLCANSWEPSVCLLGNVTARELRVFCAELTSLRAENTKMRDLIGRLVRDKIMGAGDMADALEDFVSREGQSR